MYTGITRGTCPVVAMRATRAGTDIVIDLGSELVRGLEVGASVAVDGVCLTVVRLDGTEVLFQASKETLERTTLGTQQVGSRVGIERSYRIGDEMGGHEHWGRRTIGDRVNIELDWRTVAIVESVERVLAERLGLPAQRG